MEELKTIHTPRQSKLSLLLALGLLLVSLALFAAAYWGWDLHQTVVDK